MRGGCAVVDVKAGKVGERSTVGVFRRRLPGERGCAATAWCHRDTEWRKRCRGYAIADADDDICIRADIAGPGSAGERAGLGTECSPGGQVLNAERQRAAAG